MCVEIDVCLLSLRKNSEHPTVKRHELEGINKGLSFPTLYTLSGGFMVVTYFHLIFPNTNFKYRKYVNIKKLLF